MAWDHYIYEEEPIIPNTAMREVPRAAEPEREVVTSPDEENPEDHDVIEAQEPPTMTILHKESQLGLESLFKMERSMVFPKEPRDR